MNKRIQVVLALSVLLAATPAKPISQNTAVVLSALSAPLYYLGVKYVVEGVQMKRHTEREVAAQEITKGAISAVGASALAAATYKGFYQFTPSGRFDRASKIVESMKDKCPRVFGDVTQATQEQVLYELGAFTNTHKNDRNFVRLNAVKELNALSDKLKKAESLLIAAKKDVSSEFLELCKIGAQKLYAKVNARINKTAVADVEEAKNHKEIVVKIDALLIEVRAMNDRIASLLANIQLFGSKEFKEQLKEYEELRMMRSQKTRSAVINFAIPTATVVGSIAALGIVNTMVFNSLIQFHLLSRVNAHSAHLDGVRY